MLRFTILFIASMSFCPPAFASEDLTSIPRPWVWSFGVNTQYQDFSDDAARSVMYGQNAVLKFGAGYANFANFQLFALDIHVGPFEQSKTNRAAIDFGGTGATYQFGYTFHKAGLRASDGCYGVTLGLSYLDVIGRSIGKSAQQLSEVRNQAMDQDGENIIKRNHLINVSGFFVVPGLFYAKFKPARPLGNNPDLLSTRLEGYIATLGWALPAYGNHRSSYESLVEGEDVSTVNESGRLDGGAIVLMVTGLLGA